jgi:hypothetical protein
MSAFRSSVKRALISIRGSTNPNFFFDDTLIKNMTQSDDHIEAGESQPDGGHRQREGETVIVSRENALQAMKNGNIWSLLMSPEERDPSKPRGIQDITKYGLAEQP